MIKITCINKDGGDHYDPNEGITYLGWINESTREVGRSTRMNIVRYLEAGDRAYTEDLHGKAWLVVKESRHGNKYVKTVADGRETNNLLNLPEC